MLSIEAFRSKFSAMVMMTVKADLLFVDQERAGAVAGSIKCLPCRLQDQSSISEPL